MRQVISIGTQSFEKLRENHCFYVDKTSLIQEWWENQDDVTLVTRPRRFGKTLNLSMLECFFSNQYRGRGDLFEGLAVWEEEKYHNLQGRYPVISLSFATVKGSSYETARDGIVQIIINLYTKFSFLLEGDLLNQKEKEYFDYVKADMTDSVAAMSLHRLSICMNRYYGEKVIILLDEYDTPLQEAYVNGYWDRMVEFIRGICNAAFKTNPYMGRAFLTGITRVSKESIFSDLNNLTVVTTTSEKYRLALPKKKFSTLWSHLTWGAKRRW